MAGGLRRCSKSDAITYKPKQNKNHARISNNNKEQLTQNDV
jgi:hypothetical protein